MLVKPVSIILVYLLTIINLSILTIPFIFLFTPLFLIDQQNFITVATDFMIFCTFCISLLMVLYLAFDLILGFSIRTYTKGCKKPKKHVKKMPFMERIDNDFLELKKKFKAPRIKLLISNSDEVNAFAVGSLRTQNVVLTMGILSHYMENCEDEDEFHACVNAILGHEISHLINQDYLPALLLIANDKAVRIVSKLIKFIFNFFIKFCILIPFVGSLMYSLLTLVYKLTNFILNFFFKYIIYPIYNFLKLHLSRKIEYRCDKQSAFACGSLEMALALSMLVESVYVTIFSSHPKTKNRVNYVKKIKKIDKKISISFINKLTNFFSIILLCLILKGSFEIVERMDYNTKVENFLILIDEKKSEVKDKINEFNNKINNLF